MIEYEDLNNKTLQNFLHAFRICLSSFLFNLIGRDINS
jgi:hypothetical protein